MLFSFSLFSMRFVSVHVVHPLNSIDTTAVRKKSSFILSDRSNFHMIDSLLIAVHAFVKRILTLLSVDETLLPRHVNLSINFRGPPFWVEMAPSRLKLMYSVCLRSHRQARQQRFGLFRCICKKRSISSVKSASVIVSEGYLPEILRWFDELLESVMWIVFSENRSEFSKELSRFQVRCDCEAEHNNFSRYRNKNYASVVLDDFEVAFLWEEKDSAFCPSLNYIPLIYGVAKSKKWSNFLVFQILGVFRWGLQLFCFQFF